MLRFFYNYYTYFTIWIQHKNYEGPKKIKKYFNNTWDEKNSVIVDYNPETLANNPHNWVPMIRFKGESKDATLLYLQKYLLALAEVDDVTHVLSNDFKIERKVK